MGKSTGSTTSCGTTDVNSIKDAAYLVETWVKTEQGELIQVYIANPLAQKINISFEENSSEFWGYCSWWDQANQQLRTIQIVKEAESKGKNIRVVIDDGIIYSFTYITKAVYDTTMKQMLAQPPDLPDDKSVQQYLLFLR